MKGTTPEVPPICRAIREAREAAGLTGYALAKKLDVEPGQLTSRWEASREPSLTDIGRIEEALDLPRGYLLRAAGYVDEVISPEEAIANDKRLTPMKRDLVMGALMSMLARTDA